MTETISIKNIVKLFVLVIAVWLIAIAMPITFSERTEQEIVHELKYSLVERIEYIGSLDESEFTADSWSDLYGITTNAQDSLAEIAQRLIMLEAMQLEVNALQDELDEIRALDLEISEINVQLIEFFETVYENQILTGQESFERPESFDDEAEMLDYELPDLSAELEEILTELQEIEAELEAAYDELVRIEVDEPEMPDESEDDASQVEEEPSEDSDELDTDEQEDSSEEAEEFDEVGLQEAREALYDFLAYLEAVLDEEDFNEEEWQEWQTLITQAQEILNESDDIDEINEMLELLVEHYQAFVDGRRPVRELLSITRPEFEEMTPAEIAEMAEAGGYMPVGIMPDTASHARARSAVVNACPNLDDGNFVSNVIVDGVVCVGALEGFTPFSMNEEEVETGRDFVAAWEDPTVTDIILLGDIMLHALTTGTNYVNSGVGALTGANQQRTTSVHIHGNGNRLTLRSMAAVHPRLVLGNPTEESAELELTNINIGRVATTSGNSNPANAAAADSGNAENMAIFTSSVTDSANWDLIIHNNVGSSVFGATIGSGATVTGSNVAAPALGVTPAAPNTVSRSGLFNAPDATLTVRGGNNVLRQNHTAANGNPSNVINVGNVILEANAQLTIGQSSAATHTGASITTVAAGEPGDITIGNGANLTIVRGTGAATSNGIAARNLNAAAGSTVNVTRAGAGHAINATGAVTLANTNVTMTSAGAGHGISGSSVMFRNGSNVTINRTGGAGHGINTAGAVDFGSNGTMTITLSGVSGAGSGINASSVLGHENTTLDLTMGVTGTTAATVGGHGIHAPSGVEFGAGSEIDVSLTTAAPSGTGAALTTNSNAIVAMSAINTNHLTITEDSDLNVAVSGIAQGIIATNSVEIGTDSEVNVTRTQTTAAGGNVTTPATGAAAIRTNTLTTADGTTLHVATVGSGTANTGLGQGIIAPGGTTFGSNSDVRVTRTGTTSAALNGIHTGNLIIEENTSLYINLANITAHAIDATSVLTYEDVNIDITTSGTGDGIHTGTGTTSRVEFGANSEINLNRTAGGGATSTLINTNDLIIDKDTVVNATAAGNGQGLWIQNLELKEGSQPVDHNVNILPWEQEIPTTTLNVVLTGAAATSVRVRNNGTINIRENARVRISTGNDSTVDTDAGTFTPSQGIFGDISIFNMEANSFMDIDSAGVGFRSRVSTNYRMTDGARKNIHARRNHVSPPSGTSQGRPAFVLANSYTTGSADSQGNHATRTGISHDIRLSGEGTRLNLEGWTSIAANSSTSRANLKVFGDDSKFHVVDGAQLINLSHNTTAMLFFGIGTDFTVNENSSMNIEVRGSADANAGAFRFLQSGSQTFNLVGGEVTVLATAGNAALLRAFGGNNAFYISEGGLLELIHSSTSAGADGIDFAYANHGAVAHSFDTADRFSVEGYRSEVYIRTNRIGVSGSDASDSGVTGAAGSNSNITRVDVNEGAIFVVSGAAPGELGIFNAGRLHLTMDNPLFFDFTNRAPGDALIFNTFSTTSNPSTITGTNTDLALWRNTRVNGTANTGVTQDLVYPIADDAGGFWGNMNFTLRPAIDNVATNVNNNNFAHATLEANGGSTSEPRFSNWFNGDGLTQHTGAQASPTAGQLPNHIRQNGWRQIRRMSANNAPPVVDILRTPTDADQRIFGHVTIPEGNRSARSAFDDEVFVDLIIKNPAGDVVQEIFNAPTGTRSVYGGPEHAGVFEALVDFGPDSGFEAGTTFLPIGYAVEVVTARRSADGLDGLPGGEGRENYREVCHPTHIASEDYPLCHEEGILTGRERVRDITPPEQVDEVVALVNGIERFGGVVTPATTTITGTGEPGAIVRIGWVTPTTGNAAVTAVDWLPGTTTVNAAGNWVFTIPAGTITAANVGQRLSVYISDGQGLNDLNINSLDPNRELPEVIFRRGYVPVPNGEEGEVMLDPTLNSRMDVLFFNLPRTAATQPWAGSTMGNINYHWAPSGANRTPFHDAIGLDAFDYAYILTVQEVLDSDFEFIKTRPSGTGLPGAQFRIYRRAENGIDWQIAPMATVTSEANGLVRFTGLSHGGEYRFREHAPAPGFVAPPTNHYWVITVDNHGVVSNPVPGNTDTPPINEVDDDLVLVNEHIIRTTPFEFIKTSQDGITPRPGAEFSLYRRAENGTDWEIIRNDLESAAVTGLVSIPNLRFGGEYRLIETQAPINYNLPPAGHHWIINVNINNGNIALPTHHGNASAFIEREGNFYLPNIRSTVDLFEFVKTEQDGITPLPGAAFNLYRRNEADTGWVLVRDDLVSASGTGLVSLENVLTYGRQYRLIETQAPQDFATPPDGHHWLINVDSNGNVSTPTHHDDAPAFIVREGNLFLPNDPSEVDFEFIKTEDDGTTPLPGAHFNLYRWDADEEAWILMNTAISAPTTADTPGLVVFDGLSPGGEYRLRETQAPNGFITPPLNHHHWIITVTSDGEIETPVRHGHAPNFIESGDNFYLPNDPYVPITGIEDNVPLYLTAALVVTLSILVIRLYNVWKQDRELIH